MTSPPGDAPVEPEEMMCPRKRQQKMEIWWIANNIITLMAISPQEIEKKRQRDGFGRVGQSIRKKEEARSHDGKDSSILTIRRFSDISVQNAFSLDLSTQEEVG